MPTREELCERLEALFDSDDDQSVPIREVSEESLLAEDSDGLVVQLDLGGAEATGLEARLTAWLDQGNPAFRGRTPREYLDGSAKHRRYLEAVIGALEQGVFS